MMVSAVGKSFSQGQPAHRRRLSDRLVLTWSPCCRTSAPSGSRWTSPPGPGSSASASCWWPPGSGARREAQGPFTSFRGPGLFRCARPRAFVQFPATSQANSGIARQGEGRGKRGRGMGEKLLRPSELGGQVHRLGTRHALSLRLFQLAKGSLRPGIGSVPAGERLAEQSSVRPPGSGSSTRVRRRAQRGSFTHGRTLDRRVHGQAARVSPRSQATPGAEAHGPVPTPGNPGPAVGQPPRPDPAGPEPAARCHCRRRDPGSPCRGGGRRGASAGGFEAFSQLLASLPPDPGLAIVFVQHLSPTHQSALPQLLASVTPLPVEEATDGVVVRPNRIYVTPANVQLRLQGEALRLVRRPSDRSQYSPIDAFFRSLAENARAPPSAFCSRATPRTAWRACATSGPPAGRSWSRIPGAPARSHAPGGGQRRYR